MLLLAPVISINSVPVIGEYGDMGSPSLHEIT